MAKQAKYEPVLDKISSLPDHILCHILSFLPTKYAVRTSILSPRWRYLFASSIYILDFYDCRAKNVNNFLEFVDRLFSNPNQISLECFRVNDHWVNYDDLSMAMKNGFPWDNAYIRIIGWLYAAFRLNVKKIDICSFHENFDFILPTLLFTCQSLVTLELDINAGDIDVPTNVSLPNLKTIHFRSFNFVDGSSVLRLISSCHVLEDLTFIQCHFENISELDINKLSLERLVLDFDEMFVIFPIDLKGICNVNSMHLGIGRAEMLIRMPREQLFQFHKLVELTFSNLCEDWQGTWVIEFLHRVPNLKTLHLTRVAAETGIKPLPKEVPSCLLFHLKEIEISQFEGDEPMLEMISYFLHHATFLEKLRIAIAYMKPEKLSRITKKLLDLSSNSKKCQVVIQKCEVVTF